MRVHTEELTVPTGGGMGRNAFVDVTARLRKVVREANIQNGTLSVFLSHTSASLVIQENADPRVLDDLDAWMRRMVPEGHDYTHDDEGPDDMPSHIRAAITKTNETLPIRARQLALGTWQALYVWEHRARGHERTMLVTVIGE